MAEIFELTASENITSYSVQRVVLDRQREKIVIVLMDEDGREYLRRYTGSTATTLMNQLNKANLSTSSLQKRILEQLSSDGLLPTGTVTGTPD